MRNGLRLDWFGGRQPKRGGGGFVDQVSVATSAPTAPAAATPERIVDDARPVQAVVMDRPAASGLTPAGRFKLPRG